jgi:serine protease AprX
MKYPQVSVLPTSDDAAAAAERSMAAHGKVEKVGAFLIGQAEEGDIDSMRAAGCVVETVPDESEIGWLEPGRQPLAAAAAPLSDDARNPELATLGNAAPEHYVIQFAGPLRLAWRQEVQQQGVKLGRYVPAFAYKAALSHEQKEALELLPYVRRIVQFGREQTLRRLAVVETEAEERKKRAERLRGIVPPGAARVEAAEPEDSPIYDVKCHDVGDLAKIEDVLKRDTRVGWVERGRNRLRVAARDDASARSLVAEIADLPQVSVVERYQIPRADVAFVRRALGAPAPAPQRPGPTEGSGELIGVADTGVDRQHPDLAGRIADVKAWAEQDDARDPKGHGTHVCGIICGDGTASNGELTGVAPKAKLLVQALADKHGRLTGIPVDLNTLFKEAHDAGVRIHNNSWGAVVKGIYTIDAFEVDQFAYEHPDFLIVIAAGNTGQQSVADPDGRIDMDSLQSPAAAKNALAVGACGSLRADGPYAGKLWREWKGQLPAPTRPLAADEPIAGDVDVVAAFSSRGPTDESRVKPDLVAPGTEVASAVSASSAPVFPFAKFAPNYCVMSGTSMAAPAVAGAAALLRRWYIESRNVTPSAALLKATLINGCVWIERNAVLDVRMGQPNFHQGFGRLDLSRAVPFNGGAMELAFVDIARDAPQALLGDQPERALWRRRLVVTAEGDVSVTLVWSDPPGHGVQHNLNLVVVTPDKAMRMGNEKLVRAPFEKLDRTNNVEQVRLPKAKPGTYLVQVAAQNTLFGPQGFALIATGPIESQFS